MLLFLFLFLTQCSYSLNPLFLLLIPKQSVFCSLYFIYCSYVPSAWMKLVVFFLLVPSWLNGQCSCYSSHFCSFIHLLIFQTHPTLVNVLFLLKQSKITDFTLHLDLASPRRGSGTFAPPPLPVKALAQPLCVYIYIYTVITRKLE